MVINIQCHLFLHHFSCENFSVLEYNYYYYDLLVSDTHFHMPPVSTEVTNHWKTFKYHHQNACSTTTTTTSVKWPVSRTHR